MDFYKVMLVDDEAEAREAIARCINWEEIGFQVVCEAENGQDALEKAENYQPDVILTDIQMPFMDGLTFSKKVKELLPDVKIIIFSGYDDFEYAQEAIRVEAEEYILKPINSDELIKVFERIKKRMNDDFDRRHNIDRLTAFYNESLPILREQFLAGLLEGRLTGEQITKLSSDYKLSFDYAFYCVGVLQQDIDAESSLQMDTNLMSVSLKNMCEERFERENGYICMNYLGTVVIIAGLKSTQSVLSFITDIDKMCKISNRQFLVDTVGGVGKVYGCLKDVSRSYAEAKEATLYRVLLDKNQAIYIGDVEPRGANVTSLDKKLIDAFVKEVKVGNKDTMSAAIDDIVSNLKKASLSISQLRLYCLELIIELNRLAELYEAEEWENTDNLLKQAEEQHSLEEIGDWLRNISDKLMQAIRRDRQDLAKVFGENAKSYIEQHFRESGLSVDMICSHLGVGTTYFSSVFKKETGMSFIAYLTKVRMDEAVRLLDTTEEKSYIIAGMVGYEEPTYFSYVFKKQFGVSPAKYRQNRDNG